MFFSDLLSDPVEITFDTLPEVRTMITKVTSKVIPLKSKAWIPLCYKGHWSAIELEWYPLSKILNANAVNMHDAMRTTLFSTINAECCRNMCNLRAQAHVIPACHGWCGWAILYRCTITMLCHAFTNINQQLHSLATRAKNQLREPWLVSILDEKVAVSFGTQATFGPCATLHANIGIPEFAKTIRMTFMIAGSAELITEAPCFFGATGNSNEDATMSTEQDPWEQNDPWKPKTRNCRWEDLSLPSKHCFVDEKGAQIAQVHRHQLNSNVAGIAFCTKSSIGQVLGNKPKKPFALLLPANDKYKLDKSWGLKLSMPIETIVKDDESQTTYKRQVILAQFENAIQFKLPEPVYTATLTEQKELVIEIFAAMTSAELFHTYKEKPIDTVRNKAKEQFSPAISQIMQLYGVRFQWSKVQKGQLDSIQVICKVPATNRAHILERSGTAEIFVRDFLTKDNPPTDTTIVPKFWAVTKIGRDDALRSAAKIEGFAGLTVVKRGISVRAWCANVVNMRTVLLAGDDRFNEVNLKVVPRFTLISTGWPLSTNAGDVTKAVAAACGQPPIPMRCTKSMGVNAWTLGFEQLPTTTTFTALFNGTKYEILLSENLAVSQKNRPRFSKPREPRSTGSDETPGDAKVNERLTTLESKIASVERRQDTIEEKLDGGFHEMQNQLRKVLQAVQPRALPPSKTGCTPPPKVPKQGPQ